MISREEFKERCKNLIPKEEWDKIEKDKDKKKKTTEIVVATEIVLNLILAICTSFFVLISLPFTVVITIIIIHAVYYSKWDDFKEKYASGVVSILMEGFAHSFQTDGCIDKNIYNESGFGSSNFDDYKGEDLLIVDIPKNNGTPSGVKLSICDLRVTREEARNVTVRNSNGTTSTQTETDTVTLYSGVLGYVSFPFKFKCNLNINSSDWNLEKIQLEDIHFNKKFKVHTDVQLEALVILTPTMMTKLMAFSQRVNDFKMKITKEGKMYLGMSRNLFELKVSKKIPLDALFDRFYDDISNIILMVNEIKDNDKVFKM